MNENKETILEKELEEAAGGGLEERPRLEYDKACSSFICIKCGRDHDHHKIETDDLCTQWVLTFDGNRWSEEWPDHQLDCNHCKYFNHINGAIGECLKDKQ